MYRSLAIFFALVLTSLSIAGTGLAAEVQAIRFELTASGSDRFQLALGRQDRRNNETSSSFQVQDLVGVQPAQLASGSNGPVRFSLEREPGRLDCAGSAASRRATGTCRFTGNPAFAAFLAGRGIAGATEDQQLAMTIVGTRRELVQALGDARFKGVTPDNLIAMTALNVTPGYIREMAANGYPVDRPADLIPLKALDVSPAYIRSLESVGYAKVPVNELIQLKALGVTADFIRSYQRKGYRDLSVSRLVQLKALNIKPDELDRHGGGGRAFFAAGDLAPAMVGGLLP